MLSLASAASLAFAPPSTLPRAVGMQHFGVPRVGRVMLQNEMEPDEGWNVDNLSGLMDEATKAEPAAEKAPAGISNFISKKDDGEDGDSGMMDIVNNGLRVVFGVVVVLLFAGPQLGIGGGNGP